MRHSVLCNYNKNVLRQIKLIWLSGSCLCIKLSSKRKTKSTNFRNKVLNLWQSLITSKLTKFKAKIIPLWMLICLCKATLIWSYSKTTIYNMLKSLKIAMIGTDQTVEQIDAPPAAPNGHPLITMWPALISLSLWSQISIKASSIDLLSLSILVGAITSRTRAKATTNIAHPR